MILSIILLQFLPEAFAQETPDEGTLGEKAVTLPTEEVVVVGTRTERQIQSLSGTVSVITSSEIEATQPVALDQLLKTVPGMDVQGAGEYGDKVTLNMRGLQGRYGAQRTLILIDGRPANDEYLGDFDFRFVPIEAVEHIEISKGPASALYGGLAFGGVINVVTKDPRKEKENTVKGSLGSYNSRRSEAVVSTGAETLGALLTGHLFATDGYLKNSDGSNRDWEGGQFFAKIVNRLGEESLLTFSTGAGYGTGDEEEFKFHQVSDFQYLLFETPSSKDSRSKLQLRLYRNSTFREYGRPVGDARYQQYTAGAQTQWTYNLSEVNTLTCGLEAKSQAANVGELAGRVKEEITESACYVQEEIGAGIFKFALGARVDTNEEFGTEICPRAGVTCEPVKKTVLRLAGGKAFRPPAISDLFMPPTTYWGMIFEGNPDLKPEKLYSAEVGLSQETQLVGKKYTTMWLSITPETRTSGTICWSVHHRLHSSL
jgi:outer membrane cobalamin receptor